MNREELLESYFEGLYTITSDPKLTLDKINIPREENNRWSSMNGKPYHALWLAKGLSWHNWNEKSGYLNTENMYLYRVKLKKNAKILQLKHGNEVPPRYIIHHSGDEKIFGGMRNFVPETIDYEQISKHYDGVSAYHIKGPFQSWDVPTVAVFNKNVVESINLLGRVKDVIKESKNKSLGESYVKMIRSQGSTSNPVKYLVFKLDPATAKNEMLEAGTQGADAKNPYSASIRFVADGSTKSVYVFSDDLTHDDVLYELGLNKGRPDGSLKQMMLGYASYDKKVGKWQFDGYSWMANKAGNSGYRMNHIRDLYNRDDWKFLNKYIPLPEKYE